VWACGSRSTYTVDWSKPDHVSLDGHGHTTSTLPHEHRAGEDQEYCTQRVSKQETHPRAILVNVHDLWTRHSHERLEATDRDLARASHKLDQLDPKLSVERSHGPPEPLDLRRRCRVPRGVLSVRLEIINVNVWQTVDDHLQLLLVKDGDFILWDHLVETIEEVLHLFYHRVDKLHLANQPDVPGKMWGGELVHTRANTSVIHTRLISAPPKIWNRGTQNALVLVLLRDIDRSTIRLELDHLCLAELKHVNGEREVQDLPDDTQRLAASADLLIRKNSLDSSVKHHTWHKADGTSRKTHPSNGVIRHPHECFEVCLVNGLHVSPRNAVEDI
jgi:hypothetical protein